MLLGAASLYGLYKYIEPQLPDVNALKDVQLQTPMQVYSAEGELIAQFGEKRRIPLTLEQVPSQMIEAIVATEDSRFWEHHGVDPVGIIRALRVALFSGHATQGASTITQQLARNFFLSSERTLNRKVKEAFLAIRIEQLLTKNEILTLYLNKIYFGSRAYGVAAAAQVYFGKPLRELSLSQLAMLAGLPKAPSTFNPLYSRKRALKRRNIVLARMLAQGYISNNDYYDALNEPIEARYHGPEVAFTAPYIAEMVRQEMVNRYGEQAYTDGYHVTTTITRRLQLAAEKSLQDNVIAYDMRHGYRGPARTLWQSNASSWSKQRIVEELSKQPDYGPLTPGVVTSASSDQATILLRNSRTLSLSLASVKWARPFKNDNAQGSTPTRVNQVVMPGQQIWVRQVGDQWWLAQIPHVNSALVSLDPDNGAVLALVGGFDFNLSMFNRATQALRQIGSNIKPFLYTAAMDRGFTLASIINDAPITRWDAGAGTEWRPKNSPPVYAGPIRLRQGLGQSKNVVMVRAMRAMGVNYAADYLQRFGFRAASISRTESLALGSPSFTPLEVARGYTVMTNGGFLIDPWFIKQIESESTGKAFTASPKLSCVACNIPVIYGETPKDFKMKTSMLDEEDITGNDAFSTRSPIPSTTVIAPERYAAHVINTPLAFLIKSALNSAVLGEPGWMGTGWRAVRELKRHDIGGKTGTTNSSRDAWFSGFGPHIVTTVWIGFDDARRNLGHTTLSGAIKDQISGYEGGAKSAQPAWNNFMKIALEGVPEQPLTPPAGIVTVNIDRSSGKLTKVSTNARQEYFISGTEPEEYTAQDVGTTVFDEGQNQELF